MHNNSPRMGIPLKSQTPPSIGPNTYIICDGRSTLKNRVAFLSTEEKIPKFISKTFCDTFYSIPECPDTKLGSSPRNQSPRFTFSENGIPEPGEYDPKEPKCPDAFKRAPTKGKLYLCRMPYTLKGCGPSVPTNLNENGYFLDEKGNVIPIPPNQKEPCYFYNVDKEPSNANRYRGCKWSERTAKRCFATPKDGPSPADYDVVIAPKRCRDVNNDEFRQMARLMTFLPRYLDAQEMKLKKENMPGPGQYNIASNRECKSCPSIFPKPFIRGSPRFREDLEDNPAPDAYDVASGGKDCRISLAPFLVGAPRFSRKKIAKTPGPAEYYVNSRLGRNRLIRNGAPFNTSASRNSNGSNGDASGSPSPAEYSTGNRKSCRILVSSVFKSKVSRFPRICQKLNEISPVHYNPTEAFNYIKNRQSHNILMLPFNAVDKKRGVLDSLNYDNPSPADYQNQNHLSSKGHFIPITERFKVNQDPTPGPGTYWIHPFFENNSVNKAFTSHNLKIKEDILRTPLCYHPRDTREKWLGETKKQKKMKWFANDGRRYLHCT